MNQGTAVAGGGGGSGSGDGNAGEGGDGENAAGGDGGEDAHGGGNGAGQCGAGSSGGCSRHKPSASAGDPVDPVTGDVFTEVVRDFELGGNLPVSSCSNLHVDRMYKTSSRNRNAGFGWGWTHTFAQELEVGPYTVTLWKTTGSRITFPTPKLGERVIGQSGYVLERRDDGFVLDCNDHHKRYFASVDDNSRRLRLVRIEDWRGHRCLIAYEDGTIARIDDAVGRSVRFAADRKGHVARIECADPLTGTFDGRVSYYRTDAPRTPDAHDHPSRRVPGLRD
jgi:hypothetical protein